MYVYMYVYITLSLISFPIPMLTTDLLAARYVRQREDKEGTSHPHKNFLNSFSPLLRLPPSSHFLRPVNEFSSAPESDFTEAN